MKRLLLIALFAIVLTGCNTGVSMVPFETISRQTINSQIASPWMLVLTETKTVSGILPADQSLIDKFDYSQDILIIAFLGYGDSVAPWVTKVSQLKAVVGNVTIWVEATFPPSPNTTGAINYQVISLHKSYIAKRGEITVRLQAVNFEIKASSQAYIP